MLKLCAADEFQPTLSLEAQLERISLEANFVSNMIEQFKDTVPNFCANLKSVLSSLIDYDANNSNIASGLTSKQKMILKIAKQVDYLVYAERIVSVPENFKGEFIDYAKELNKIALEIGNANSQVLGEFNRILATFLTNKDAKTALKDNTVFFTRIDKERENVLKHISSFFPKSTGISKCRMKDVLSRLSDVEPLVHETIKLTQSQAQTNLRQIESSVKECVELLDIIIDQVKNGTVEAISPEALKNIVTGSYIVGRYVEFIGVVYFDITVFLNKVDALLDTIATADK